MGHVYRFHTQGPIMRLSAVLSHLLYQGYRQYEAGWSGSQIANTQTHPDSALLEPFDCNKVTMDLDTLSIFFRNFFQ